MKTAHIFFSTTVLIAYFLLLGCKKDDPGSDDSNVDASITIPEKSVTVSYAAGNKTISVTSEGAPWTAAEQPDVDWITDLTKMGNESLQVTYNENTASQTRTATLEIKAGNKTESITFSQKDVLSALAGEYLMDWSSIHTVVDTPYDYSGTGDPLTVTAENGELIFRYSIELVHSTHTPLIDTYTYTVNQIQTSGGSINNYQLKGIVQMSHSDHTHDFSNITITNIDGAKHTLNNGDTGAKPFNHITITSVTKQ